MNSIYSRFNINFINFKAAIVTVSVKAMLYIQLICVLPRCFFVPIMPLFYLIQLTASLILLLIFLLLIYAFIFPVLI